MLDSSFYRHFSPFSSEQVLICRPEEIKRINELLNESCPPLQSCLSEDKNGMTHAILEVVAGGIVQTATDIHRYVRCTLLNSTKPFQDVVKSAQESLRWLCHGKFLEWNEDTKLYSSTPLGRASFGSSLSPEESLVIDLFYNSTTSTHCESTCYKITICFQVLIWFYQLHYVGYMVVKWTSMLSN